MILVHANSNKNNDNNNNIIIIVTIGIELPKKRDAPGQSILNFLKKGCSMTVNFELPN